MSTPTTAELCERVAQVLNAATTPMTVTALAKRAGVTDGAALAIARHLAATGAITRLPATGPPAPYLDRYTPAPAADRSPTVPDTAPAAVPAPLLEVPSMLAAALAYATRGWHVFPLVPDAKRPAIARWEERATTDHARIERCWASGAYGIGIACGPSGLIVVDLDTPKPDTTPPPAPYAVPGVVDGADALAVLADTAGHPVLWDTHTVATGRGGTHLYYAAPTGGPVLRNTAGALGWLIDTRAAGGYVVAPPSTVEGRPYTTVHEADPAQLPDWLTHGLAPPPLPAQRPVPVVLAATGDTRRDAYLTTAVRAQVEAVATATPGTRNRALYLSTVALGQLAAGGALPVEHVAQVLTAAAITAGLSEHETARTITSGLRAGARRPRHLTTGVAA